MEQVTLTGNVQVGKAPDGTDLFVVQVSPFRQYIIPLPDEPGPNGEPSAKQAVKDALNGGVQIAPAGALDALR